MWRHARWRTGMGAGQQSEEARQAAQAALAEGADPVNFTDLWGVLEAVKVPVFLARGMAQGTVVDDADEEEFRKRQPNGRVEHFEKAGHSIQGDMPVELARSIEDFAF